MKRPLSGKAGEMSTLRLPGLLTGIDTDTLITQLMAIERRTLNVYEERKSESQEELDALNELETKLSTLQSSVSAISDAGKLRAYTANSSDTDIMTAEASRNAFEGNHTVVINQLANAERLVHTTGIEYAEDYVGEGTFIYSCNNKETVITTTSTTTLEDLVGLINNDPDNPGVTASLLFYNDSYHLVLNGNDAGSDYQISINDSNTEVWKADSELTVESDSATLSSKITELDQFTGTLAGGEKIVITGKDHNGNAVTGELNITDNTKLTHLISEINDAFDGRATATLVNGQINLTDDTCGTSQMELTLTYDAGTGSTTLEIPTISQSTQGGSTTADLSGFTASDFTETQSAQDSQIKVDGFPSTSPVSEVQHLDFANKATGGTFTLTYDGHTTDAINSNATLEEIQAALEALPNLSVGDVTVGGDRLTVNNGTMTFTFSDDLGDVGLLSINPANLTPSDNSNYVMTEQTKGTNGWISRSSNTIDDVIHGVTLHLKDSGTVQVNLTRDIESVKEMLSTFIDAYNAVVSFIGENTDYDPNSRIGGVLMGDYTVSTIKSRLRLPLYLQTSGFVQDIDTFLTPGQIGLEFDGDGLLNLDSTVFDAAVAEDYMAVLALIGADKTGSSDSNTIKFYDAHTNYTAAGTYDVRVTVSGGVITGAQVKLSTESTYRDATFSGNIVTGDSSFDDNGYPVNPENGLQLSVDLTQDGTFTATVRVKQGFAGAIKDSIDRILKPTTGSIQIDQEHVGEIVEHLQEKIEAEESRLTKREAFLVAKFARLERTLALIQNQLAALGIE